MDELQIADEEYEQFHDQDADVYQPDFAFSSPVSPYVHQASYQDPTNQPVPPQPAASSKRVTTCPSPYLNVFYFHNPIRLTLDTGATVNMIHESVANQLGLVISPSNQIATQADGKSELKILGEVRFQVQRDDQLLHIEGLVARNMDTEILAGIPFIAQNDISIHPANNMVMIKGTCYPYGSSASKPTVARVKTSIARCSSTDRTVWPGEFFEAQCDINPSEDTEVAVEPHWMTQEKTPPIMTRCLKGTIRLVNDSEVPIKLSKNQHVAHVVHSIHPEELPDKTNCPDIGPARPVSSNVELISINADKDPEFLCWEDRYKSLHHDFEHVFYDNFPGYNGHSGKIMASVNVTNCLPPQRKGRIPLYNRDKLVELQQEFDEFERLGVFGKPEDHGINVEYVNPPFL
jgi:hypothetical protein